MKHLINMNCLNELIHCVHILNNKSKIKIKILELTRGKTSTYLELPACSSWWLQWRSHMLQEHWHQTCFRFLPYKSHHEWTAWLVSSYGHGYLENSKMSRKRMLCESYKKQKIWVNKSFLTEYDGWILYFNVNILFRFSLFLLKF